MGKLTFELGPLTPALSPQRDCVVAQAGGDERGSISGRRSYAALSEKGITGVFSGFGPSLEWGANMG